MSSAITNHLEGKTIVITGASSGLGKSIAKEFARTSPGNSKLVLTARRIDNLRDVATQIQQEAGNGDKLPPVQLDVDQPAEIEKFFPSLPDELKDADILVNNAGLVRGKAQTPDIESENMAVIFDTNVTGLINMTQAILPIYKTRPDGGRGDIINIGSIAGPAVSLFTDALCKELIATRIYVVEIDLGQVETVVVFAAGLRENVVIADTMVYSQPSGNLLSRVVAINLN
ncbi:hypothetical protein BJX62DRAFT_248120 [Aspergillus germanicus]